MVHGEADGGRKNSSERNYYEAHPSTRVLNGLKTKKANKVINLHEYTRVISDVRP
jgi:hypothetical protein